MDLLGKRERFVSNVVDSFITTVRSVFLMIAIIRKVIITIKACLQGIYYVFLRILRAKL